MPTAQPQAELITELTVYEMLESSAAGPSGPAGTDGLGATTSKTAGVDLSALRVARPGTDGRLVYADNTHPDDAIAALYLTLSGGVANDPIDVLTYGEHTDSFWSWVVGEPIYLSTVGHMTRVRPTIGFVMQVAACAAEPATILFDPRGATNLPS